MKGSRQIGARLPLEEALVRVSILLNFSDSAVAWSRHQTVTFRNRFVKLPRSPSRQNTELKSVSNVFQVYVPKYDLLCDFAAGVLAKESGPSQEGNLGSSWDLEHLVGQIDKLPRDRMRRTVKSRR